MKKPRWYDQLVREAEQIYGPGRLTVYDQGSQLTPRINIVLMKFTVDNPELFQYEISLTRSMAEASPEAKRVWDEVTSSRIQHGHDADRFIGVAKFWDGQGFRLSGMLRPDQSYITNTTDGVVWAYDYGLIAHRLSDDTVRWLTEHRSVGGKLVHDPSNPLRKPIDGQVKVFMDLMMERTAARFDRRTDNFYADIGGIVKVAVTRPVHTWRDDLSAKDRRVIAAVVAHLHKEKLSTATRMATAAGMAPKRAGGQVDSTYFSSSSPWVDTFWKCRALSRDEATALRTRIDAKGYELMPETATNLELVGLSVPGVTR